MPVRNYRPRKSWYMVTIPRRYDRTQEGYFGQGFGSFFVKAETASEAKAIGFRKFVAWRKQYDQPFGIPPGANASEFKVRKLTQEEIEEECLTPAHRTSWRRAAVSSRRNTQAKRKPISRMTLEELDALERKEQRCVLEPLAYCHGCGDCKRTRKNRKAKAGRKTGGK